MLNWGDIFDLPVWEIFPGTPEQRPFEVMQYTGLKDKNGREVFEGDIVTVVDVGEVFTGVVIYDLEECDFKATNGEEDYGNQFIYISNTTEEIEVLGNVYKNPELLKEANRIRNEDFQKEGVKCQ